MALRKMKSTTRQRETDANGTREQHVVDAGRTAPVVGIVPSGALYWRCLRISGDAKTSCRFALEDGVEVAEWPIAEVSVEVIRSRWGTGTYKLQWIGERDGKRVPLGWSKLITLTTPKRSHVAASTPPVRPDSELDHYLRLQRMMRQDLQGEVERKDRERERELERRDREHEREIERERLASRERIAQVQSFWQAMAAQRPTSGGEEVAALRVQVAKLESRLELERALARRGATAREDSDDEDAEPELVLGMPKELVQGALAAVATQFVARMQSAGAPPQQANAPVTDDPPSRETATRQPRASGSPPNAQAGSK